MLNVFVKIVFSLRTRMEVINARKSFKRSFAKFEVSW